MNTETTIRKRKDGVEKLQERAAVAPAVDVFENKDQILILADLPGVEKDKISINFAKGQITLEGRASSSEAEDEAFDYRRTFVVPQGIDTDKIQANLTNGVLRVVLPKQDALKPRAIEVKVG